MNNNRFVNAHVILYNNKHLFNFLIRYKPVFINKNKFINNRTNCNSLTKHTDLFNQL